MAGRRAIFAPSVLPLLLLVVLLLSLLARPLRSPVVKAPAFGAPAAAAAAAFWRSTARLAASAGVSGSGTGLFSSCTFRTGADAKDGAAD